MKFIAIIPARYASTRFPGKPLVDMRGKAMIQRVYEQVSACVDTVYVATDDSRIYEAVERFGGRVVMTSENHRSGTDRCWEAYERIGGHEEVVINVQGDEPFIQPRQIQDIMNCFDDPSTQIATLVKPFSEADGETALFNPNSPKVVLNDRNEAMYFSRSVVPYLRNYPTSEWLSRHIYYKHIGMYAYRADVLSEITQLPQSSLEMAESLEQLRWLQNGYRIKVGVTAQETIGIDTPADLEKALHFLDSLSLQPDHVPLLLREAQHLLLDRRAVPRALALAVVAREAGQLRAALVADRVRALVGVGHVTGQQVRAVRDEVVVVDVHEAQRRRLRVRRLLRQPLPVDRAAVQARRCARGEALHGQVQRVEELRQVLGGRVNLQ